MPDVGAMRFAGKRNEMVVELRWLLGGDGRRDGREKRECRKDREKSAHEIPPTRAGIDLVPRALS